ncbi:hypothetical protein ON010_g1668 [Phytophthora cinnamomi]|nr:hypothetical protein ON010_g1668 [Phytophthora cinnamomi]
MWRAIATRQKERRVEAEAQQRQLRAAVIGRARLIHQMNALLSQRPSAEDEKSNLWQNQCDDDGQKNESGLLQTFIGELDDMYARTDQITAEMEFKMSSPLVYKPAKTFKHGVEVFDSADATVIPFGFEETCRATSLLMMTDPSAVRYGDVCEVQKNTVTAKYQVQCQLSPGERSRLMIHVAVRRYQEPGRLVFVWRALNEGLEALYGYHSDERGWLVLRPHNGDYPSTIMESYVRFVPVSVGCNKEDTDRFAEVVVKTGEEEVNEMMKMLEKILLTEAN